MTLLDAVTNKAYKIIGIKGQDSARRRLLDMGFTPDSFVYVAGSAPMGGAILVALRGAMIALREDAASSIVVEAA